MSGDCMSQETYDYIKKIQDDCLNRTNMTKSEAWDFAFRCWQLDYKREEEAEKVLKERGDYY